MKIQATGEETFLYLNGLSVEKSIKLTDHIELLPAHSSLNIDDIFRCSKSEIDFGVLTIFLKSVKSQFRISSINSKELAILAWNSVWDAILLSSLYNQEIAFNIQCDKPIEQFNGNCDVSITNYQLRGLGNTCYHITHKDILWLEMNFGKARSLLEIKEFQNAVHSMATYKWHSMPNVQLAILWSGIESLFKVQNELVFRLSLYISKFLYPNNKKLRIKKFIEVQNLYKARSSAVHGSKIKNDVYESVNSSACILNKLIFKCIEISSIPKTDELAP